MLQIQGTYFIRYRFANVAALRSRLLLVVPGPCIISLFLRLLGILRHGRGL